MYCVCCQVCLKCIRHISYLFLPSAERSSVVVATQGLTLHAAADICRTPGAGILQLW